MEKLEIQMINELISFFNQYVIEGLTENIKIKAKEIESKYLNTSTIVSDIVTNSNGKLTYFYASIDPGPIDKEEARELINNLQRRKKELTTHP